MAPSVTFYGQPYDEEATAGAFVRRVLSDDRFTTFTAVVAWARFRGIRRISDDLDALRSRGGAARLVVGIDEGIATRPGLLLALRHFSEVFVLHDRPGVTFHPKLYLAEGDEAAALLVGSGNLTAGGLFSNYEAALEITFSLPQDADEPALQGAKDYIGLLLADEAICLPLDEDLTAKLVANPRYGVSERELRRSRRTGLPEGLEPEDVDPIADEADRSGSGTPLFGRSAHSKPPVPPLPPEAQQQLRELEGGAETPPPRPAPAGASAPPSGTEAIQLPPEMLSLDQPVLVAELSKSRGASQANFHKVHYEGYFGARRGSKQHLKLRQVVSDGEIGSEEPRETVEVASQNYRLEMNGFRGRSYPSGNQTPIAAFVQRGPKFFLYSVLWPSDPGHAELSELLDALEGPRSKRSKMRQRRATINELHEFWPDSPLVAAISKT